MPKIALVFPPSDYLISQKVFPYLGILYLAAELREFNISIIDIGAGDILDFSKYDVICYSSNVTQAFEVKKLVKEAKNVNPDIYQIVGGVWPSITKDYLGADCIIYGAGELSLKKALIDFSNKVYRKEYYPICQDINKIKFPARDLIDLDRYEYYIKGVKATPIISSRGCPFNCGFCSKNPYDKFKMRSPDNFSEEVDEIISFGFKGLVIYDDTLNVDKNRFKSICSILKQRNVFWKCHIRADLIDEELIKCMASSGCVDVAVGFESGSNTILKNINKKTSVLMNTDAAKLLHKYSIGVRAYLILGLPGESKKTIEETRSWLVTMLDKEYITSFGIGNFMPYPGSPIYENIQNYDVAFDKNNFDLSNAWYRGSLDYYPCFVHTKSLTSEEIAEARKDIAIEFKDFI